MHDTIRSILVATGLLMSLNAGAVSFSADAVQLRGIEISHARMFWKDDKVRFEYMARGVPMVQIFDNSSNQMIWLDTENKVYLQRALNEHEIYPVATAEYRPCDQYPDAECDHLKSTEINGRETDKWLLTFNEDGQDRHVFQWVDKEHQILVRQENPDGSVLDVSIVDDRELNGRQVRKVNMTATSADGSRVQGIQWYDAELDIVIRQQSDHGIIDELRNIRIEAVPSELFSIPGDYAPADTRLTDLEPEPVHFGTGRN